MHFFWMPRPRKYLEPFQRAPILQSITTGEVTVTCQTNCWRVRQIAGMPDKLLACQINCWRARYIAGVPDKLLVCAKSEALFR